MFTTVTTTLAVTISSVHFHANVMMVTKVIVLHVLILTDVSPVFTIVTQMQNVLIQKEVSTVIVTLDMLEAVLHAVISMTPCYAEPKISRSRDNKDYLAEAIENSKSIRRNFSCTKN